MSSKVIRSTQSWVSWVHGVPTDPFIAMFSWVYRRCSHIRYLYLTNDSDRCLIPCPQTSIDPNSPAHHKDQSDICDAKPNFQVSLATAIRTQANIPTAAAGLITKPEHAEHIIATDEADAVFLTRAMLPNPRRALTASERLG
jgi:hypothetical protein